MTSTSRLLLNAVLRLILLGLGMWFAFSESSLPGAPLVSRAAIVVLFVALALLVGEVGQLREHMGLLLKVLRAGAPGRRDDREAVEILIQGLSAAEGPTRERAHHHLKRLTGQDLPPDAAAWQVWWDANRETFSSAPTRN